MIQSTEGNSTRSDGVMDVAELEREWEPLSFPDYAMLAFTGTWQFVALVVCVHLLLNRHWPPYVTKNVTLVIITGVSGALWFASMTIAWGYWDRKPGDFLANCKFEVFFSWCSLSLHAAAFILRPYRVWKLLVKHDGSMWRTEWQILLITSLCLVPSAVAIIDDTRFNYNVNACGTDRVSRVVGVLMNMVGLLVGVFLWCVCVRDLRGVRKQFNEYGALTWSLLANSMLLVTYPVVVTFLLAHNNTFQRRLSLLYPVVTTYVMFWGPIHEPFRKKLMGDEEYLFTFTKGFSSLPTPAQLKASLAEQLSVDQLRTEFRKYIKTKIAQELIDFYQDSLDREEVEDFFERQAVTMRIIEQFIREGSRDQVNISQECREKVLQMDATDHTIFDDARLEVLRLMETNFHREFSTSAGFKKIADAAEREAMELSLLRAEGVMPESSPGTSSNHRSTPVAIISSRGIQHVRRLASFNGSLFAGCATATATASVAGQNQGNGSSNGSSNGSETARRGVGSRFCMSSNLRNCSPSIAAVESGVGHDSPSAASAAGPEYASETKISEGSECGAQDMSNMSDMSDVARYPWGVRRCRGRGSVTSITSITSKTNMGSKGGSKDDCAKNWGEGGGGSGGSRVNSEDGHCCRTLRGDDSLRSTFGGSGSGSGSGSGCDILMDHADDGGDTERIVFMSRPAKLQGDSRRGSGSGSGSGSRVMQRAPCAHGDEYKIEAGIAGTSMTTGTISGPRGSDAGGWDGGEADRVESQVRGDEVTSEVSAAILVPPRLSFSYQFGSSNNSSSNNSSSSSISNTRNRRSIAPKGFSVDGTSSSLSSSSSSRRVLRESSNLLSLGVAGMQRGSLKMDSLPSTLPPSREESEDSGGSGRIQRAASLNGRLSRGELFANKRVDRPFPTFPSSSPRMKARRGGDFLRKWSDAGTPPATPLRPMAITTYMPQLPLRPDRPQRPDRRDRPHRQRGRSSATMAIAQGIFRSAPSLSTAVLSSTFQKRESDDETCSTSTTATSPVLDGIESHDILDVVSHEGMVDMRGKSKSKSKSKANGVGKGKAREVGKDMGKGIASGRPTELDALDAFDRAERSMPARLQSP